jgi:sensor histidine kinase YesM
MSEEGQHECHERVPRRTGVGLVNVRRRLEAVYGKRATLAAEPMGSRYVATICIPDIERAS